MIVHSFITRVKCFTFEKSRQKIFFKMCVVFQSIPLESSITNIILTSMNIKFTVANKCIDLGHFLVWDIHKPWRMQIISRTCDYRIATDAVGFCNDNLILAYCILILIVYYPY